MNQKIQEDYINFLRGLFKGTEPTKYIQLATGILPIKRARTQSASIILMNLRCWMPALLALLMSVAFTEEEVKDFVRNTRDL